MADLRSTLATTLPYWGTCSGHGTGSSSACPGCSSWRSGIRRPCGPPGSRSRMRRPPRPREAARVQRREARSPALPCGGCPVRPLRCSPAIQRSPPKGCATGSRGKVCRRNQTDFPMRPIGNCCPPRREPRRRPACTISGPGSSDAEPMGSQSAVARYEPGTPCGALWAVVTTQRPDLRL